MLLIMILALQTSASAQETELLPGKWTGVQYVRSTTKKDKQFRTASLPEISDSTYMELSIDQLVGNTFSGTLYRSFFQQPQDNFCTATVDGTISKGKIVINVLQIGENKLKKYPGFYWCAGTLNLMWKPREDGVAELSGKSSDAECFSGPVTLQRKPVAPPPVIKEKEPAYTSRKDSVFRTIRLQNKQFTVELFDNGVVDGDSVTVYFNRQVVAANKLLTAKAISLTLTAEENAENVLVMYANNLGTVAPNTAVMKIKADGKVYDVFLKADLQGNAVIKFELVNNNNRK
ncbi:MAG: hypothetical protein QM731_05695 [Chitinophagaceae bacterium]